MRVVVQNVTAFTIYDAPELDPILVVFQDFQHGKGRMIVECFGSAWSAYWNAMGEGKDLRQFVGSSSTEYLTNALWPMRSRRIKREEVYLTRIVDAVKQALAG